MRICYVNGAFVPENEAVISIFDRGFLFSDGVYEVCAVLQGQLVENKGHLARLSRSLEKLGIAEPLSSDELIEIQKELIAKNSMQNGAIYLQVTRGSDGDRDFLPTGSGKPTVVLIPQPKDLIRNPLADRGIKVMTMPEIRWAKRDIKTVGLLGAVLAKQLAKDNGFDDAWFIEDGLVTEGSSNNVFIIKDKEIITKKPNTQILNGITRQSVMQMAEQFELTLVERDFPAAEAQQADEVFVTSATMLIVPVTQVDDRVIGDGKPGEKTRAMRDIYIEMALASRLP